MTLSFYNVCIKTEVIHSEALTPAGSVVLVPLLNGSQSIKWVPPVHHIDYIIMLADEPVKRSVRALLLMSC